MIWLLFSMYDLDLTWILQAEVRSLANNYWTHWYHMSDNIWILTFMHNYVIEAYLRIDNNWLSKCDPQLRYRSGLDTIWTLVSKYDLKTVWMLSVLPISLHEKGQKIMYMFSFIKTQTDWWPKILPKPF